jgi:hypothetical protein
LLRDYWRHFLCVSASLLGGCGSSETFRIAKEATIHVHAEMDSEQFTQIYSEADDAPRAAAKRQNFLDCISAVHGKLGWVQNASPNGFFVNLSTSGTRVRLNYQTKFDAGVAQEEFIWKIKGHQAGLVGNPIN